MAKHSEGVRFDVICPDYKEGEYNKYIRVMTTSYLKTGVQESV
jgi:hypothetical protein